MKSSARAGVDGNDWFDDLFIDNNLMTKALITDALVPDGEETNWIVDGVHVHAKRSPVPVKGGTRFRYEFVAEGWRMDFDALFDNSMRLNHRKSIIKWVADHGPIQRGDKGQAARRDLHAWLCSLRA